MRNTVPQYGEFDPEPSRALGGVLDAMRRRPVDTLAGVLAAGCTVMILVNALALQEGRHPAPIFGAREQAAAAAPQRSELVAQIQTALAERDYFDGTVDGVMGTQTASAIRSFEQAQGLAPTGLATEKLLAAASTAPIRTAPSPAPARQAAAPAKPAAPATSPATTGSTDIAGPRLMAVQKALAKLGYGPVTVDGKMGLETRNALKTFQRDRKLPETGEPTAQSLRALQQVVGAPL